MAFVEMIGRRQLRSKVVLVGLVMALAGCSSVPDYLNPLTLFEDDTPAAETAGGADTRARAEQTTAAVGDNPYPALSSVPERPETPPPGLRARVVEGLVADRTNARYTAEAVQDEAAKVGQPGSVPAISTAVGPTSSATTVDSAAVRPAAGPAVAAQAGAAVTAPAPPPLQEAVARPSATRAAAVPLPAIPPAPGGATVVRAPSGGEQVPAKPSGRTVAGGAVDAAKAEIDRSGDLAGETMQLATIQFGHNSTSLDRRDEEILRQIASVQQRTGGLVRVVGHASGSVAAAKTPAEEQVNFEVSVRRAQAVAQALVRLGLNPAMIQVEGQSDRAPLYDGSTQNGEAGNRRAEIYLVL